MSTAYGIVYGYCVWVLYMVLYMGIVMCIPFTQNTSAHVYVMQWF